jgi:hypothetical protein
VKIPPAVTIEAAVALISVRRFSKFSLEVISEGITSDFLVIIIVMPFA